MVLLGDEANIMRKLVLVLSDIVLILTQDRCTVYVEYTKAGKSFWTHLMELLGDVCHVESHLFLFGDNISVGARLVHSFLQTYHRLRNHSVWT
jgi:hypothetical protein